MSAQLIRDLDSVSYYQNTPGLSYSKLSNYINTSEAQAVEPFQSTDDMRFGRAFHHIFLHRLIGVVVTVPTYEISKKSDAGNDLAAHLEKSGKEYFKPGEQEEADFMCEAFFQSYPQDPAQVEVVERFRTHGMIELTIIWVNEAGERFKSRLDSVVLDPSTGTAYVLDLKTDGNLDADKLYWKYRNWDYDLQMYVYCRALLAAGYRYIKYYTLSIERESGAYCLSEYGDFDFADSSSYKGEAFENGEKKYVTALERYRFIQSKINNKIPLSHSVTPGVRRLIHPAYEQA